MFQICVPTDIKIILASTHMEEQAKRDASNLSKLVDVVERIIDNIRDKKIGKCQ